MEEWPSPVTTPRSPPPVPPPPPPASSLSGGDFDGCVDITPPPLPLPLLTLPPLLTPPLPKVVVRWLVRQGRLTACPLPATVGAGLGGREEEFSPMWEDLSGRMGNGRGLSTYSLIARGPHRTWANVTMADASGGGRVRREDVLICCAASGNSQ